MTKVEWPEWMEEYPIEFWDEAKVQQYVKMAHEYLSTMREKAANHQEFKDMIRKHQEGS